MNTSLLSVPKHFFAVLCIWIIILFILFFLTFIIVKNYFQEKYWISKYNIKFFPAIMFLGRIPHGLYFSSKVETDKTKFCIAMISKLVFPCFKKLISLRLRDLRWVFLFYLLLKTPEHQIFSDFILQLLFWRLSWQLFL